MREVNRRSRGIDKITLKWLKSHKNHAINYPKKQKILLNTALQMITYSWLQAASFIIFLHIIVTDGAEFGKYSTKIWSLIYWSFVTQHWFIYLCKNKLTPEADWMKPDWQCLLALDWTQCICPIFFIKGKQARWNWYNIFKNISTLHFTCILRPVMELDLAKRNVLWTILVFSL